MQEGIAVYIDMKTGLKTILKSIAAVAIGLALLDLFCYWYYNPAGYIRDESRATDVIREPGQFTSRANEGFSWTNIDENGYVNREVPGEDGVFVLMMGSSHAEGLYVQPGDDMTSQLNGLLRENGLDGFAYNIGISNHDLTRNVNNLDRALTRFEPSGYVVIETRTLTHSKSSVYSTLNGSRSRIKPSQVVLSEWISERPLLRTVYRQLMVMRENEDAAEDGDDAGLGEVSQELQDEYLAAMTDLFALVHDTAEAHGVTPIILYHPQLILQEDGSAVPNTNQLALKLYAEACDAAGVCFLNLTDAFLERYAQEHILPHGFINTAPGVGHLNADGNRIAAEAVCAEILRREAAK